MVPFEFQEMIFSLLDVYLDKSPFVQVAGDDWEAGECGNSYLIEMKEVPSCSHGNVAFECFWLLDIGRDIENHHNDIHTSVHLYLWCFDCNKNFADVQTLTLSQPHLVFQAAITESQDFGPCWASENKLWSRRWFQIFFYVHPEDWENFIFFKWAETINRWSSPDLFHEVVIFKRSECTWVFPMNDENYQYFFTTMLLFLYLLSLKHPKTRTILENRPSQKESNLPTSNFEGLC